MEPGQPRQNLDRRAIAASLGGRLKHPVTIERLARDLGAPFQLVRQVVLDGAARKRPEYEYVDTVTEDGERRMRWRAIVRE